MAYNKLSIQEKLAAKAKQDGDCLAWFGDKDPCGYGRIRYAGVKGYPAHRLAYELKHGPIPSGMVVRHKCDNPSCINTDHLELGTQKDNVRDMYARGRQNRPKKEQHGRAKLTEKQVEEIRSKYIPKKYWHGPASLAREYGVSKSTIHAIVTGKNWK